MKQTVVVIYLVVQGLIANLMCLICIVLSFVRFFSRFCFFTVLLYFLFFCWGPVRRFVVLLFWPTVKLVLFKSSKINYISGVVFSMSSFVHHWLLKRETPCITALYSCLFLSKLPYEVTPEQAMSHEEVRNRLEASSMSLRAATDKVLNSIVSSLDNIP